MTLEFAQPAPPAGLPARAIDPAFNAHYLTILRLCMRQLGDRSDAEDATQETFRRALQQREMVVGDPLPWLIAVARNLCIDELRRRRTGRGVLERTAAQSTGTQEDAASVENPERVVVGRMFVNELLGQLTPAERRVVAGTLVDGQCGGDLAASLGVTTSTARVLLARARQKLRRYLEDGQAQLTGIGFAGWRALDGLRQRVFGGPAAFMPRPELLLPALVITALVSTAGAPAAGGAPTSGVNTGTTPPSALRLDLADSAVGRSDTGQHAVALGYAGDTGGGQTGAGASLLQQPHTGAPVDGLLPPPPDPDHVWVSDIAASPGYASDHTIYMVGMGNCSCDQIFRSRDGGATWTFVPSTGLTSSQLLLPPAGFAGGRFYGGGGTFVQLSTNSGGSFQNTGPVIGHLSPAPAWLGADVVEAGTELAFLGSSQVPTVADVFPPGEVAVGSPVLLQAGSGFQALQLVQNNAVGGADSLLRCTVSGCTPMTDLPIAGDAQLLASPNFAIDHTLLAFGTGVAVSHDGGASFTLLSTQVVADVVALAGPAGTRLVGLDASPARPKDIDVLVSDDLGRTWFRATATGHQSSAHVLRLVAPGLLIASAPDAGRSGQSAFVCSSDGATWSTCA